MEKSENKRPKEIITNKKFQKKVVRELPKDAIQQQQDLQRGLKVLHQVYDLGYIKKVTDDEIEIVFDHYGSKKFMVDYCLTNGMLRFAEGVSQT